MAPTTPGTKVVTGEVRLSYCHLFEPYANAEHQNATPKYSTVILVPKSDTKTIKAIEAAQRAALENGKASKFAGKIPPNWKNTFRDGDDETEVDLEKNPEYAGHMFMTVSNTKKVGIVDQQVQPILDHTQVYSGCYARVSINAYPFNTSGNKGVSFGLQNVQLIRDGEPLGSISSVEDDFSPLEESLI